MRYMVEAGAPIERAISLGRHRLVPLAERVEHAAITENKRLGAVLAHIQDLQATAAPSRRTPIGKQATKYQKTERRNLEGWNSKLARRHAAKEAEAVRGAGQASDP